MHQKPADDLRLEPDQRLCPAYDEFSFRFDPELPSKRMGVRVVDNCPEEHIM